VLYIFGGHGYIGSRLQNYLKHRKIDFLSPTRSEVDLSRLKDISIWLGETGLSPNSEDTIILLSSKPKNSEWYESDIHESSVCVKNLQGVFPNSRFLYTSSSDVYGTPASLPLTEDSAISLESAYAYSKYEVELVLSQNLPLSQFLILRLPGVYGGMDPSKSVLNGFVSSILNESKVRIHNQSVLSLQRDWVYRNDLVESIVKMAQDKSFGLYNFAPGFAKPIDWWVRTIAEEANIELQYEIEGIPKNDRGFDLTFNSHKLYREFGWIKFSDLSLNHFNHDKYYFDYFT